ncbi:hypothetical protein Tco_0153277 [Tanacetum coccineum]
MGVVESLELNIDNSGRQELGKNYGLEDGRISCARLRVSGGGGMGTVGGGGGCGVESGVEKEVVDLQHLHAILQELQHLKAILRELQEIIRSNASLA